jgi:hypothetical protein
MALVIAKMKNKTAKKISIRLSVNGKSGVELSD